MDTIYPGWRAQFATDLASSGFERRDDDGTYEVWEGEFEVQWDDAVDSEHRIARHRVQILIGPGFPFAKPLVVPIDAVPPIRDSRHQAPGDDRGPLCLWPDEGPGWHPSMTAELLLDRVRIWFVHHHCDDWPGKDRPPDLHLYFASADGYPLMLIGDDWSPPTGARTGRFGLWQRGTNRVFSGGPTSGVSMPPTMHSDRLLSHVGLAERRRDRTGLWFRLGREPRPHATLASLLEEIDAATDEPPGWALAQLRGLVGDKIRRGTGCIPLALGYPSPGGAEEWLFLDADLGGVAQGARWATPRLLVRIRVTSFETAPAGTTALMRRTGHIARALDHRRALVFGMGAIGGSVALLLAKAGLPKLRTVDSDRLRPGNAVRHVAGLSWVGERKTMATKWEIHDHAPDCEVEMCLATWDPAQLAAWVGEADVVVDATANLSFSLLLNEICLRGNRPAVYVAAHRRAAIGRVRVVRPGRDACLVCYEAGHVGKDAYLRIPPADEGAFIETGCGVPTIEASAIDIEAAANWAARAALWLLEGKLLDDNHCLVVSEPLPDADGVLTRLGVHWECWAPIQGCEACGSVQE